MGTPKQAKSNFILYLLVLVSASSVFSTDMYVPSMAHLPEYFDTTAEMVQLTISINVLIFALAQLFYGPLSDRYGRRKPLIIGMTFFVFFTLVCGLVQSIEQLIVGRALQGMAAAVEAVLVLVIISDLYEGKERIKALALFGMTIGIAPAVAPIVGGFIDVALGWRANFFILSFFIGLVLLVLIKYLPESTEPDPSALELSQIIGDYRRLLTNRVFMGYTLMPSVMLGTVLAFITIGPFVYIDQFGVATEYYGFFNGAVVLCFALGSLIANRSADHASAETLLRTGIGLYIAGACLMTLVHFSNHLNAYSVTIPMCVIALGIGFIFSVAPSHAMDARTGRSGYAAATLSTCEMLMAGIGSVSVTLLFEEGIGPLVTTIAWMVVVLLIAKWMTRPGLQAVAEV